jgi:hypothetical protein
MVGILDPGYRRTATRGVFGQKSTRLGQADFALSPRDFRRRRGDRGQEFRPGCVVRNWRTPAARVETRGSPIAAE